MLDIKSVFIKRYLEDTSDTSACISTFITKCSIAAIVFYVSVFFTLSIGMSADASAVSNEQEASTQRFSIKVKGVDGKALPGIIVELGLSSEQLALSKGSNVKKQATMDQIDEQFSPHTLVVSKGTHVSFPNSDEVKHHVYSFSPAKAFEQQLYKGKDSAPILFDKGGIVELGCNIHDWMLAYIYVSDSEFVTKTDHDGIARFDASMQVNTVHLWHPLFETAHKRLTHTIDVNFTGKPYEIQLTQALTDDLSDFEDISITSY